MHDLLRIPCHLQAGSAPAEEDAESIVAVDASDSITLDAGNLKMSKQERDKLRQSLQSGIQDLKEAELIKKLQDSDPLLGA